MRTNGRLLVLQHLDVEHPGVLRDFLGDDGISWDTVELDVGESIPALEDYLGLWVMGGPMDVWEETEYPWLATEKAAIRHAVDDLRLPFLGICLGHQLLAAALGGDVGRGVSEVGVMPVSLNADGRGSPLFSNLPTSVDCLQWHGAEVKHMPQSARCLAHSHGCAVQAMAVREHAFSAQFHVEVTGDTVNEWSAVPAYADALEDALGHGAATRLEASVDAALPEFNRHARIFYDNWMRVTGVGDRARRLKA